MTPGSLLSGKYRIEQVLREGGTGVVVAATHVPLGQPVTIKLVRPEALGERAFVDRLLHEARAAACLRSAHVARVRDVGITGGGAAFIVTERLHGIDLEALLARQGPQPVPLAVDYILQACDAVAEAHARGLVHRNLKPANLFLAATANGSSSIKVLHFGSAVLGAPAYMSPEQLHAAYLRDPRTDVWSLGVTLWELLTGSVPFRGRSFTEVCLRITLDPLPASPVRLPPGLEAVLRRALEKVPARRFATIAELAAALAPFTHQASRASAFDTLDRAVGERRPASAERPRPTRSPAGRWLRGTLLGAAAAVLAAGGLLLLAPPGDHVARVAASAPIAVPPAATPDAGTAASPPGPRD